MTDGDSNDTQKTIEQQFQEKPDWKGKLKSMLQKSKGDVTGFITRATSRPPKPPTGLSPLSEESNVPFPADPVPTSDRTLTGMIRQQWTQKIKPKFSRGKGGDDFPPPPGPGFKWDSGKLNLIALILAITLIAWTGADLLAFFAEKWIPEAPIARVRGGAIEGGAAKAFSEYQIIISRNLFSSLGRIPGDEVPNPQELSNEPVRTSLPLNLIGTVILKNEMRSIATIEDKGDSQVYPFRVDDELPGKIKIISIEAHKVVFRNLMTGKKEFIDMPEEGSGTKITVGTLSSRKTTKTGDGGIEQVAPNTYSIARTELDKYLANINDVLTQARAIPHFENGQPAGYKLIQIVPGSVYEKLGLKDGDVLSGVNGEPITDPARAFELLSQLKTANQLELTVKRDGRASNMSYNFK